MDVMYPVLVIINTSSKIVSQLLLRSTSTNVLPGRVSGKAFIEKKTMSTFIKLIALKVEERHFCRIQKSLSVNLNVVQN